MNKIAKILLKGLVAILPIGLTLYFVYWLFISVEKLFRPIITTVIAENLYLPGMGLIFGLVLLFIVGLVVNAWVVQRIIKLGENVLERIPLIKSVHGALRDFMDYFSPSKTQDEMKKVVMVNINDVQLIGFVTGNTEEFPSSSMDSEKVAVYLPMSYQIGGFTVYLPKNCMETLDMSVEDAMRRVLTAGLSNKNK